MNTRSDTFSANLPPPTGTPWRSKQMPWSNPYTGVMHFTAVPNFTEFNHKRKSNTDVEIFHPPKQHITEEKVTATLNSLHISHDFVAHNSNIATEQQKNLSCSSKHLNEDVMDSDVEATYTYCSSKDLEEKLRRAKHITIHQQFKNIKNNESMIPQALLEHYEKPSKALVIWQPPPKIKDLLSISIKQNKLETQSHSDDEDSYDKAILFTKNLSKDFNNVSMETDVL